MIVSSQFRESTLAEVPASLTVLDTSEISARSLQHFEELTTQVPNLNWSGEGSRARYFQIRGTGELAQYEGAPNPSVGFLVDDIDLSGIGAAATLFDTDRIEVLRGPQGTRYGANALAGLIYVRSTDPTPEPALSFTASAGGDDTAALGAIAGGAVPGSDQRASWRLAVQHYRSNGFRDNAFLGRDDTNDRDELTLRAKVHWDALPGLKVDLTALHVDLENGYDAFAIDNGFTTYSNRPGKDAQRTDAAAVKLTADVGPDMQLVSLSTAASSDMKLGFDADWGNNAYWSDLAGAPTVYDYLDANDRDRDTLSQEFRLLSGPSTRLLGADWLVGVYALKLKEQNVRTSADCSAADCDPPFLAPLPAFSSDYDATNLALFGELDIPVGDRTHLVAGLRWEQRTANYEDANNDRSPRDPMVGGSISLDHRTTGGTTLWTRVARGYKAGGVNPSLANFPDYAAEIDFDPEYLWSVEAGTRLPRESGRRSWSADFTLFWQRREELQIEIPRQAVPGDPATFFFYTENADRGRTYGAELELHWSPVGPLDLYGTLGLLRTEITDFKEQPELEGRDLAHAPRYNFALGSSWRWKSGWFVRADLSGKDQFYIDYCQQADCDDPQIPNYAAIDLRAGRIWGSWDVTAWMRNALDEDYAVRGFYFGNEPPDFPAKLYTRQADPRHAGITVTWSWK